MSKRLANGLYVSFQNIMEIFSVCIFFYYVPFSFLNFFLTYQYSLFMLRKLRAYSGLMYTEKYRDPRQLQAQPSLATGSHGRIDVLLNTV